MRRGNRSVRTSVYSLFRRTRAAQYVTPEGFEPSTPRMPGKRCTTMLQLPCIIKNSLYARYAIYVTPFGCFALTDFASNLSRFAPLGFALPYIFIAISVGSLLWTLNLQGFTRLQGLFYCFGRYMIQFCTCVSVALLSRDLSLALCIRKIFTKYKCVSFN